MGINAVASVANDRWEEAKSLWEKCKKAWICKYRKCENPATNWWENQKACALGTFKECKNMNFNHCLNGAVETAGKCLEWGVKTLKDCFKPDFFRKCDKYNVKKICNILDGRKRKRSTSRRELARRGQTLSSYGLYNAVRRGKRFIK